MGAILKVKEFNFIIGPNHLEFSLIGNFIR